MQKKYYNNVLKKLETLHIKSAKWNHKKFTVREGNKTIISLDKREIEDLYWLWKLKSELFYNHEYPLFIKCQSDFIDNSKYREFNSQFSPIKIQTSGSRGYGKSYAMIEQFLDYSGFEIIEPPKELKKTFDKINKEGDLFLWME